jgi:hypothetical protein
MLLDWIKKNNTIAGGSLPGFFLSIFVDFWSHTCVAKHCIPVHSSFCGLFDTYSQRRTYEVPTRYRANTGKVFFIILILKQSSRYRRRQRIGTSRYCYDLYYVPPAIVFFAAERPCFNLGAYWVVKPLKFVFYNLKGRGPLKNSKKFVGMLTN